MQNFRLVPFQASTSPKIEVIGEIARVKNQLSIRYEVSGDVEQIAFPAPADLPTRKDDLWRATCFEFFLAIPNQSPYWEFNMSPSGDWNVYAMDAYRRVGFREEMSIAQIQFKVRKEAGGFTLIAKVDLNPVFRDDQILQLGITAVIQTNDGDESYWALAHPGMQADFHLRESFQIQI